MSYTRSSYDTTYTGRRRWSGNFGRVWLVNGTTSSLLFEIVSFEAKVTPDREDVIVGQSKDSKIVSLTGEGTIVIQKVFNRGFKDYLNDIKKGHDVRVKIVATLSDPDMVNAGEERIEIDNVWFNEIDIMHFAKGEVVETEIPFGFTSEDCSFVSTVELSDTTTTIPSSTTLPGSTTP